MRRACSLLDSDLDSPLIDAQCHAKLPKVNLSFQDHFNLLVYHSPLSQQAGRQLLYYGMGLESLKGAPGNTMVGGPQGRALSNSVMATTQHKRQGLQIRYLCYQRQLLQQDATMALLQACHVAPALPPQAAPVEH